MDNVLLRVAAAIACGAFYFACSQKLLAVLAEGGYRNGKFIKWLKRKDNLFFNRLCLLSGLLLLSAAVCAVCFSVFGVVFAKAISAVPFFFFLLLFCLADRKYALKAACKKTARVKRLSLVYLFLLFAVNYILVALLRFLDLAIDSELYSLFAFLPFCLTPVLLPFLVVAANAISSPFENAKNRKYVKRMGQVLDETKILRIGVVGSYGKTSVKNVLKTLLAEKFTVVATPESYNTPVGIAKTVESEAFAGKQIFIAEMGARKRGDIKELCEIVKPDYALFTGVCPQHIESFGSEENVFDAKCEILDGVKTAVVCGASLRERISSSKRLGKEKCVFVEDGDAEDVRLFATGTSFSLRVGDERISVKTKLLGNACVENVVLCVKLCRLLGMTADEIARGVEKLDYIPHRLELKEAGGAYILDDGYNCSVASAKEAVTALKRFSGDKIVVTPGIVEAGILEKSVNESLGEALVGLDEVILVGETLVLPVKNGYASAGGDMDKLRIYPTLEEAKGRLAERLKKGDCVLFLNDLPDIY